MRAWLGAPVDAASLVVFRVLFGLSSLVMCVRFVAMGWVDTLLLAPAHHLHYAGFTWVTEPPRAALLVVFALQALAALCVAVGLAYRAAAVVYLFAFTYVELVDRALYLNHHYAVALLAALLIVLPLGDVGSLDAMRATRAHRGGAKPPTQTAPRWALLAVRAQLGVVYFFAGVAKLHPDWWSRAEPLQTWLGARGDFPILGPLFGYGATAYAMSWAGLLFDLSVPLLLTSRRTRLPAYLALVVFHALTGALFSIGMFPWLMSAFALVFFEPDWPRVLFARLSGRCRGSADGHTPTTQRASVSVVCFLGAWFFVQLVLPVRHLAYRGDHFWTYEGFDFAWHVMIVEKGARADLRIVDPHAGTTTLISATPYYTTMQARLMSENPALIVQFAHEVAADFAARGHPHVRVYARSFASLNGRPMRTLVDPRVDLTTVTAWTDTSRYVVPLEERQSAR